MAIRVRPQIAIVVSAGLVCATLALAEDRTRPSPVHLVDASLTSEQARAFQKEWADYLGFDVEYENSVGMKLRVVPPGTFRKGTPPEMKGRKKNEGLANVSLSEPFLIGQFELPQEAWENVMGATKRKVGDRLPTCYVSHSEARDFCRALTQLEQASGSLPNGYQYRLPTEAEWEYACRAGTLSQTYFGEGLSSYQANIDGARPLNGAKKGPNIDGPTEVGSYPPNAWGLYDMHGNLSEWCLDWYHEDVKGGVDPVQLEPSRTRLLKDCHWGYTGFHCKSANRYWRPEDARSAHIGFRPVLTKVVLSDE